MNYRGGQRIQNTQHDQDSKLMTHTETAINDDNQNNSTLSSFDYLQLSQPLARKGTKTYTPNT